MNRSAWLVVLWCGGCGTETGNPEFLPLGYNARTSEPGVVALGSGAGEIAAAAVWLRLGPVDLRGDCDRDPVDQTFAGLGFADHADPAAVVQQLEVETQTACLLHTSFEVNPDATGEDPEIQGTAVALTGTLSDGRGFEVLVREPVPLDFALDDEPVPAEGSWLMSFDIATWLDPAAIEALPGDPVVVTADDQPQVYARVLERLRDGVQLTLDLDDDGQVGPGERRLDSAP